ncbi:MAG: hydrolase TatD, partial [Myxococcota bacterium]
MKLFDAYVYSDTRTDADLDNLAWFGVERVVSCAHAPRRFDTARDLWQYFEQLIGSERDRLRRAGL